MKKLTVFFLDGTFKDYGEAKCRTYNDRFLMIECANSDFHLVRMDRIQEVRVLEAEIRPLKGASNNFVKNSIPILQGTYEYGSTAFLEALKDIVQVYRGLGYVCKIACIKTIRGLTGWGIKESKEFVENFGFQPDLGC